MHDPLHPNRPHGLQGHGAIPESLSERAGEAEEVAEEMKTIICGGRNYRFTPADITWLDEWCVLLPITEVVTGGASGADEDGKYWALQLKLPTAEFKPNWKAYGKAAGPMRNAEMSRYAEACIVFPGGRGTADMRRKAAERGLRVVVRE